MIRATHHETLGSILGLALAASSSACDSPVETGTPVSRAIPWHDPGDPPPVGTWPPSGGTLNTASLGDVPLMRVVLPGYPQGSRRPDDAYVEQIEVLGQWKSISASTATAPLGELVVEADGIEYGGADLVGSRWWLDPQQTRFILIAEHAEAQGRHGYQLEYHTTDPSDPGSPICEPDHDGDHWAYVVGDVLVDVQEASITADARSLLVACASGALGKALSWGFTPWKDEADQDLALYQAGVRTVMADYCGTGTSFTEDGTLVQVSNAAAGQTFLTPEAGTEAVFGPGGALCLTSPRVIGPGAQCTIPTCGSDEEVALLVQGGSALAWTKLAG